MLLRLIAAYYSKLLELALWVALSFSAFLGYHFTLPIMNAAGATPSPELAWKILGALFFAVIAFLGLAAVTRPIATLLDIKRAVGSIEARLEVDAGTAQSPRPERRDPTI